MAETQLDRKLFGIGESYSKVELKQKYRELLKQYHPDLHNGDAEYHYKIIRLNEAYGRLTGCASGPNGASSTDELSSTNCARSRARPPASGVVHHKDPAYVYYKEGIRHYRAIYPSARPRVIKDLFRVRQLTMRPEEEAQLLERIFTEFSRAIYYFTLVTTDYEESVWYADAQEKVHFLMRHLKRYQAWKENLNKRRRAGEHETE